MDTLKLSPNSLSQRPEPVIHGERSEPTLERWLDTRQPPKPRDPPTRPSHLKARQRFPTHPLVKISKVLPAKLPLLGPRPLPAEIVAMSHDELSARFLRLWRKF